MNKILTIAGLSLIVASIVFTSMDMLVSSFACWMGLAGLSKLPFGED